MNGAYTMLEGATAPGATSSFQLAKFGPDIATTFQAVGSVSESTGAATVNIEVSNNGVNWLTLGTIELTLGTAEVTDGFAAYAAWAFIRANLEAISGTDATVSVFMGA
jgi:hypothetical protein